MAKGLHTLTHVEIKAAPAGRALRDGGGLSYRASEKGFGRWAFRFTSADAEYLAGQAEKGSKTTQREMGLGSFPETSLDAARRKAAAARDLVARDLDPIEEAKRQAETDRAAAKVARAAAQANTMTFGRYADEVFLPTVLPRFSNAAHLQQWRATFATHAARLRDTPWPASRAGTCSRVPSRIAAARQRAPPRVRAPQIGRSMPPKAVSRARAASRARCCSL
jgi:Arm DNA-binding domain